MLLQQKETRKPSRAPSLPAQTKAGRARMPVQAGAGPAGRGAEAAASGGAMSWPGGKRRVHMRVFSKVKTSSQRSVS